MNVAKCATPYWPAAKRGCAWPRPDRYALGLLKAGLSAAAAAGRIEAENVDVYAHVLLATLVETALLIARSDDPAATIALAQTAVATFIRALFAERSERERGM